MENWILNQLTGPAQVIARNLLQDFHRISHALYTFIGIFKDTIHYGKFDFSQAWEITSSFVQQIFTEIGYARVSARDAIDIDSPCSIVFRTIFSTLHAHYFMGKSMSLLTKYHPSISSEW